MPLVHALITIICAVNLTVGLQGLFDGSLIDRYPAKSYLLTPDILIATNVPEPTGFSNN